MNLYEITIMERDEETKRYRTVVLGEELAATGLAAIHTLLAKRFSGQEDLLQALHDESHTFGSNKRLVLAGITFEARKVAQ